MLKSDLAAELTEAKSHTLEQDIDRCDVYVDKALSNKIGKPAGNYVTVESRIAAEGNAVRFRRLSKAIADVLRELAPGGKNVLTVGLGNKLLTADALGCLTIEKTVVYVTEKYAVRVFAPGVAGVTGIESYDVIKGLVEAVAPDLVIAVGTRFSDRVALNPKTFAKNATIIQIDIDPSELGKNAGQRSQKCPKTAKPRHSRRQGNINRRAHGGICLDDTGRRRSGLYRRRRHGGNAQGCRYNGGKLRGNNCRGHQYVRQKTPLKAVFTRGQTCMPKRGEILCLCALYSAHCRFDTRPTLFIGNHLAAAVIYSKYGL